MFTSLQTLLPYFCWCIAVYILCIPVYIKYNVFQTPCSQFVTQAFCYKHVVQAEIVPKDICIFSQILQSSSPLDIIKLFSQALALPLACTVI